MHKKKEQAALRVARHSLIANVALTAFKLFAGIFAQSAAMVSDAVHSLTDLVGTVIAIIGIKLGNKQADKEHPYGHERFESVATLALAALIAIVGVGIGWAGVQTILAGDFAGMTTPGVLALVAAVVSLAVKESLFWYVRAAAKKVDSSALMADAWHSRADGLSSIGSFIGILGARMGFPVMDSVAAIVISLFIIKTAVDITRDAISKMTDRAWDPAQEAAIRQVILSQPQVASIDLLNTRVFGNRVFVDLEIGLPATLTFADAHHIMHQVHDAVETQFPKVKHCKVHANPVG